jgi:hypothetical protein
MVSDEKADELFSFGLGIILGDITYGLVELMRNKKEGEEIKHPHDERARM